MDEAIDHYKKAIAADPKHAQAHNNLGAGLAPRGKVDEAIDHYKKAIAADPKYAQAHFNLGVARFRKAELKEAKESMTRAFELFAGDKPSQAVVARRLQTCEHFLKLEERLPRLLRGEDKPSSARESLDLATLCRRKRTYAAAARFFDSAFAADSKLADDVNAAHRYDAACSAALAAAGKGEDAAKLDDKERARLRKQALGWLRADLALFASGDVGRSRVARFLGQWQKDPDLAGLRDAEALKSLSAEERQAWQKFWADVQSRLAHATGKPPT
jgi:hypothetical protein